MIYLNSRITYNEYQESSFFGEVLTIRAAETLVFRASCLCSLFEKHYDKNNILVTPDITQEKNLEFNNSLGISSRWQILLALRYPHPIKYVDYRWQLSEQETQFLAQRASIKSICRGTVFLVVKPTANEKQIGVFVYKRRYIILAPLSLLASVSERIENDR